MKYLLFLLIFTILIIGCAVKKTPDSGMRPPEEIEKVPQPEADYLWAFSPSVNVRGARQESADKLIQLTDGDSVAVVTNQDGWYQIRTDNQTEGWVRSDLLGPKNFSAFKRAVDFVDSLRDKNGTELYLDKNLYHKRIYIQFPSAYYQSRTGVEEETKTLLRVYQKKVYRGDVTARVLKPGSEDEFLTLESKGEANADPLLPVILFGVIKTAHRAYPNGINLTYSAPADISDQQLLKTARALSASYPLTYKKVEIVFVTENGDDEEVCRLWFVEDSYGEEYKFNDCR